MCSCRAKQLFLFFLDGRAHCARRRRRSWDPAAIFSTQSRLVRCPGTLMKFTRGILTLFDADC